ncbi:MAG: acetyl-CoA C-acetyltransferase [Acidobacteria bacterium]|nr:acetyl-CoA C-acetyltransferase [Acidobacteriota bacterium]
MQFNAGRKIVIVNGARTPMAEYNGALREMSAIDLGAVAARTAIERSSVEPGEIDHVVMGNALQTSGDAIYGARHVGLKAGVAKETPALTLNRLCGSGIQSVMTAAEMLLLGEARLVLAGGMESMSQAPHVLRGLRTGLRLGEGKLEDSLMTALLDTYCGLLMAQTAEKLARVHSISREDQDLFALRSQKLAGEAAARGWFKEEMVPVELKSRKGSTFYDTDDHARPDTTIEGLAQLKPSFGKDGFVTPGNASGIVDGAAAVVVTTEATARERMLKPLGRIVSWAVCGVEPDIMGIGPVPAIRAALDAAGLGMDDISYLEINEAFAAQYLAVEKVLGLDRAKVNVNGGAIALGHPLAASGTRLLLTLLMQLKRTGARYGVASACIGGGQGIAMVVENATA